MVTPTHKEEVTHRLHLMCRLFGHSYQHTVRIYHNKKTVTGYSVCKRCGDQDGATTFGPFNVKI